MLRSFLTGFRESQWRIQGSEVKLAEDEIQGLGPMDVTLGKGVSAASGLLIGNPT
jgi:hypothetical protein